MDGEIPRDGQIGILFVCLGNICRSPAAEGVLLRLVAERGLDGQVIVESAGTGNYHVGERADARMREAADRRGLALDSRARQVEPEDLDRWDLVVAMDRDNLRALERLARGRRAEVRLFGSFLPEEGEPDVPDPYFGGGRGFDVVLDMLERAMPRLLDEALALAGSRQGG